METRNILKSRALYEPQDDVTPHTPLTHSLSDSSQEKKLPPSNYKLKQSRQKNSCSSINPQEKRKVNVTREKEEKRRRKKKEETKISTITPAKNYIEEHRSRSPHPLFTGASTALAPSPLSTSPPSRCSSPRPAAAAHRPAAASR